MPALSCGEVGKASDPATCEADTSQTPTSLPFEETSSWDSVLNITTDEEILPEATEKLQNPVTPLNPWRTKQKKK